MWYNELRLKFYCGDLQSEHAGEQQLADANEILELVRAVQDGRESAFGRLLEIFTPLTRSLTDRFYGSSALHSAEKEDLLQEATIALYKAALRYDFSKTGVTFGLYAKICIKNRLISAKRHSECKKRRQLSGVPSKKPKRMLFVSENFALKENYRLVLQTAEDFLSDREKDVLRMYLSGMHYKEMAERLGCDLKSVDNALSRAKKKIKNCAEKTGINENL